MSNSIQHGKYLAELSIELVDIRDIHPTGSSYTCNPPVENTDIDFVVRVEDMGEFLPVARDLGWDLHGEQERYDVNIGPFKSLRRDNLNLIVTDHPTFYERYVLATKLAKKHNLLDKADRIELFKAIIDVPQLYTDPKGFKDSLPKERMDGPSPSLGNYYRAGRGVPRPTFAEPAPEGWPQPSAEATVDSDVVAESASRVWAQTAAASLANAVDRNVFNQLLERRAVEAANELLGARPAVVVPSVAQAANRIHDDVYWQAAQEVESPATDDPGASVGGVVRRDQY